MKGKGVAALRTAGRVVALLIFTAWTAYGQKYPDTLAGFADQEPGYKYEAASKCEDIVSGTEYAYLQNDSLFVSLSPVDGSNNGRHSIHRGSPMDVINKRGGWDNLDWTQFLLSSSTHGSWNVPTENPDLDSVWMSPDLKTVHATGYSSKFPNIRFEVGYSLLGKSTPILKIEVDLINEGTSNFSGFLQYQMDPDGASQDSWVEGLGNNPGTVTSGWNGNFIYSGILGQTTSAYPAHGIAWLSDQPVALVGLSYLFGAWFNADVAAGDTTRVTFYHISDVPDQSHWAQASDVIGQWAKNLSKLDPAYGNKFQTITGRIEDVHGKKVTNASLKIKNINAELVSKVSTDTNGVFTALVPKDVYTVTVAALGYNLQSRSIDAAKDSVLDFTINAGFALSPVSVWVGTGKEISATGYAMVGEGDFILENDKIAVGISNANLRSQILYASRGVPVDMIVKGIDEDYMDWLQINHLSFDNDTTESWWYNFHVLNDTVYVKELTASKASLMAEGRYFRLHDVNQPVQFNEVKETHFNTEFVFRTDIKIVTEYSIEPGDPFFSVTTHIENQHPSDTVRFWAGDILDLDGSAQVSYVPGVGDVTGDWGLSKDFTFTPNAPWFAQYVAALPVVGVIYESPYADNAQAYGVGRWMSFKKQISIAPSSTYEWKRKVAANSAEGYNAKSDAIADVYNKLKQAETGLTYQLLHRDTVYSVGDTVKLTVRFTNTNTGDLKDVKVDIHPIGNLVPQQSYPYTVGTLSGNSTHDEVFAFVATSGGRGINPVKVIDTAANVFQSSFPVSVVGKGWYAGDNHTHSVYSDGVGTIAENVTAGYAAGLSFMTATDHNTINQKADVDTENAKYADMIIMTGEEVTTSRGHALAYNTERVIPWNMSQYTHQQMIDSTLNCTTAFGHGFFYLAHPHYPGLPWQDYTVRRNTGIEVWNGFYHATHSVNALTFNDWDSLNNLGLRLFGISNSDAHNPAVVGKNYVMAYLEDFSKKEIISVLRDKGCYYGTNGPRLDFEVETHRMGSDVFVPTQGRQARVVLKAQSMSEQPIDYIRLLKNGKEEQRWTPVNTREASLQAIVTAKPGDFIRMEVKAGTGFAYSNPIWFAAGSPNTRITEVKINGSTFTPFDTAIHSYVYPTVVTATPTFQVTPADSNAKVEIYLPEDINDTSLIKRTATVVITAQDGLTQSIYTFEFNKVVVGTDQELEVTSFKVFPVPAQDRVYLVTEDYSATGYTIRSATGALLKRGALVQRKAVVDVSGLENGVYLVQLQTKSGATLNQKMIINR